MRHERQLVRQLLLLRFQLRRSKSLFHFNHKFESQLKHTLYLILILRHRLPSNSGLLRVSAQTSSTRVTFTRYIPLLTVWIERLSLNTTPRKDWKTMSVHFQSYFVFKSIMLQPSESTSRLILQCLEMKSWLSWWMTLHLLGSMANSLVEVQNLAILLII